MSNFKNKKILLAMTNDLGFYKSFITNLNNLGFEVTTLTNPQNFKYKNIIHKIINFVMRNVFRDKTYKKKLKAKYLEEFQLLKIKELNAKQDYFLTIRPDVFSKKVLSKAISKAKKAYAYQWDGLARFPDAADLVGNFNKFYFFDKNDVSLPNTSYLTNFYFDCYQEQLNSSTIKQDVYYIGSYDDRINDVIKVCSELFALGLSMKIIIPCSKRKQKLLSKYPFFTFPDKEVTYKDNLKNVFESRIILDFGHKKTHSGLSFRPYEALGYSKKLITTNRLVKDYDFYEETNFFIVNTNSSLVDFVNVERKKIAPLILKKYSFSNWISYVLEDENCLPI